MPKGLFLHENLEVGCALSYEPELRLNYQEKNQETGFTWEELLVVWSGNMSKSSQHERCTEVSAGRRHQGSRKIPHLWGSVIRAWCVESNVRIGKNGWGEAGQGSQKGKVQYKNGKWTWELVLWWWSFCLQMIHTILYCLTLIKLFLLKRQDEAEVILFTAPCVFKGSVWLCNNY